MANERKAEQAFISFSFIFLHFINTLWEIWSTFQHSVLLLVNAGFFVIPPNSDMDYRISNVRAWSSLCMRDWAAIEEEEEHGDWAHRQRVSTTRLTRKNLLSFSCAPDGIQTRVMECEVRHSTNWATPLSPLKLRGASRYLFGLLVPMGPQFLGVFVHLSTRHLTTHKNTTLKQGFR